GSSGGPASTSGFLPELLPGFGHGRGELLWRDAQAGDDLGYCSIPALYGPSARPFALWRIQDVVFWALPVLNPFRRLGGMVIDAGPHGRVESLRPFDAGLVPQSSQVPD